MRVVLDTNEYISAFIFGGPPREALERAERGEYELVISAPIQEELARVLAGKFGWASKRIAQATAPLWEIAHFVTPSKTESAARDEADNRIIECAREAEAEVIVSNDKDLLSLNPYKGIFILRAHEFIAVLDSARLD